MRRVTWLVLLLIVAAEAILAAALYQNYANEVARRVEFSKAELTTGLATIVDGYRQVVEAVLQQAIRSHELVDLVAAANRADSVERNRLRGRLYRELYPVYDLLRQRDIRVLQLVLADGRSFLRFNRPDLYDDDIAADRPLLHQVLTQGLAGQAFENGRAYPGFRYSFPLVKDGRVIGAADFSASFDALHRVLAKRRDHPDAFNRFLMRRDLLHAVIHPSAASLFRGTPIHPALVTEDPSSGLRDINWTIQPPHYVDALERALGRDRKLTSLIDTGRAGATHRCLPNGACFMVALKPVEDSLGRPAAYAVSYAPFEELPTLRAWHLAAFTIGSLLLLGGGTAFRHWLVSRRRLQTISEHMAEGLYVMDRAGRILFSNVAASDLMGYRPDELVGRGAHELFHVHDRKERGAAQACAIRRIPMAGGTYQSDDELFRRKDGTLIRVSVTSSPLREEGEITGAVVLFRDITAEHRDRMRLKQSDIAFRNLAEAVLVTDAQARIQAVNRAFTAITGYTEGEVLGRNPRVLASGRHDRAFYETMWSSILTSGAWQGEIWNRRKNGEVYPEWLNISAIRDERGEIVSFVSVFSDITELRRKEERLRDLAFHDQLTGLPNRTSFLELFERAIQRSKRRETRLALLYLDLDRFKHINDTLGHTVGDRLLKAVAQRLRRCMRGEDLVARLGGDELTVLLEDIPSEETPARIAHKLLDALRRPFVIDGKQLHVTASIGISLYPQDGRDAVGLLKNADAAMYLAKQRGRSEYAYFTVSMAREAEERFALESDLRRALQGEQLVLHYQPKVQSITGEIIGLEALLRWQHPTRGLLSPVQFLEVARDAGLLPEITKRVVRSVSRQVVRWRDLGLRPGRVAVNLDDQTFNSPEGPRMLERWVLAEGAAPVDLELEITETVMLHQGNPQPQWQGLVEAGFELSIDDFGTGESSLFRLKHLPVRTLKVDKSFVDDIDRNESDRAILRSIVTMAKSLGKMVLAEGVEREPQLEMLREIGCDSVQGYLVGRPAPAETVTALLRAQQEPAELRRAEERVAEGIRVH